MGPQGKVARAIPSGAILAQWIDRFQVGLQWLIGYIYTKWGRSGPVDRYISNGATVANASLDEGCTHLTKGLRVRGVKQCEILHDALLTALLRRANFTRTLTIRYRIDWQPASNERRAVQCIVDKQYDGWCAWDQQNWCPFSGVEISDSLVCALDSPLVVDRPIMNAVKYRVVSGVVWTNRTMVSSNTDTNRTGVLAVVDIDLNELIVKLPSGRLWRGRGGNTATAIADARAMSMHDAAALCRRSVQVKMIVVGIERRRPGTPSSWPPECRLSRSLVFRRDHATVGVGPRTRLQYERCSSTFEVDEAAGAWNIGSPRLQRDAHGRSHGGATHRLKMGMDHLFAFCACKKAVHCWDTEFGCAQPARSVYLIFSLWCYVSTVPVGRVTGVPLDAREAMWFQQDGVPPHFAIAVLRHSTCTSRIGGYVGEAPIAWSLRSPDITPPDFWLWGHTKTMVYETPVPMYETPLDTRNELTTPETFAHVRRNNMLQRCTACVADGWPDRESKPGAPECEESSVLPQRNITRFEHRVSKRLIIHFNEEVSSYVTFLHFAGVSEAIWAALNNEVLRADETGAARAGETGDPREKKYPPTSGIVRHDPQRRKFGVDPSGNRTRFVLMRKVSSLATTPPRPLRVVGVGGMSGCFNSEAEHSRSYLPSPSLQCSLAAGRDLEVRKKVYCGVRFKYLLCASRVRAEEANLLFLNNFLIFHNISQRSLSPSFNKSHQKILIKLSLSTQPKEYALSTFELCTSCSRRRRAEHDFENFFVIDNAVTGLEVGPLIVPELLKTLPLTKGTQALNWRSFLVVHCAAMRLGVIPYNFDKMEILGHSPLRRRCLSWKKKQD
ncbi:hypothetical protein PR048_030091 [Dryococelus australis]|uniref:Transglutaminase-like domain-containing protein n=1 Tax=Dryococelus australis TaxID=614101 RepID=A0ABQ9G7X9_9NEOP|nr:hypothetical protein PR048_030091 [Dryococelus australis]